MDREALTPAQHRVVDDLLVLGGARPTFRGDLGTDLRARLEDALAPLAGTLVEPLWVSKQALGRVHACEGHYVAELESSGWTIASCEGEITHRAVQLSVAPRREPVPMDLVDRALEAVTADGAGTLAQFLRTLAPAEVDELRARAANAVSTFLECWPALPASWWPRTELPLRVELCGGRIVLSGRVDLCLGRASGLEARCLFVDLKTRSHQGSHLDDLRFYALVQAMRIGVPPFRIATYYLDSASFLTEDVTPDLLETALRRTCDGARKMAELRTGARAPVLTANSRCRYCRLRLECDRAPEWEAKSAQEAV